MSRSATEGYLRVDDPKGWHLSDRVLEGWKPLHKRCFSRVKYVRTVRLPTLAPTRWVRKQLPGPLNRVMSSQETRRRS
jgi:hypothetical protein